MEVVIEVPKDKYKEIKSMNAYDFNTYLLYKLKELALDIESNSEEALVQKIEDVKERMTKMMDELTELTEFYEKAAQDKEKIESWLFKLDDENAELLERVKNGESNN